MRRGIIGGVVMVTGKIRGPVVLGSNQIAMPYPIIPQGADPEPEPQQNVQLPQRWFHRTNRRAAQALMGGAPPSLPFWGSSFAHGAQHKRGSWVVEFEVLSDDPQKVHLEDSESRNSAQGSFLRDGEWWINVVRDRSIIRIVGGRARIEA